MTASLAESRSKFTADPSAGQTNPQVTAVLANGHARLSAGPFNWESDLPPAVGGRNQAASPTAYLLGALAGCAVAFINDTLAPEFDVEITDLKATAACAADLGGLLGIDGAVPDLQSLRITISIDSPSPENRVQALQQAWLERCPVYLALSKPNDVTVSFS